MDKNKTVMERLAEAIHSGDLSHREQICDVDYVNALGMAARRHRHGAALLELDLSLSATAVPAALKASTDIVRRVADRHGWSMTPMKARRIGMEALRYYLRPACEGCRGRGVVGVERGQPETWHPRPCSACSGSGRRPLPVKYQREIRAVLYVMESERRAVGAVVRKKMRIRARVE